MMLLFGVVSFKVRPPRLVSYATNFGTIKIGDDDFNAPNFDEPRLSIKFFIVRFDKII